MFLYIENIIESSLNTSVLFKTLIWLLALCTVYQTLHSDATIHINNLCTFFFFSSPLTVLFNMHDTDNDGTITLEEYKHVRHINSIFVKHRTYVTLHKIHKWFSDVVTKKG